VAITHIRKMVEKASKVKDGGIESEFEIFDVNPECL